ncbi:Uncharacterized protein OBRU01_08481 [Operophtera brumata]|uniref:SH3 domain-containing protein n=1 Tax=Operophtera brumata TaxID=104452 RepID=A0A0L7LHA8_OPEBR|nr:Uncharacterized protein OBRU01_08481 [Operophtera brumata]
MPSVGKCQTKSRLLRRQKSTSEIESHRIQEAPFDDERVEDGWLPGQRLTKISFKGSVAFDDEFDNCCDEAPSSPVHSRRLLSARGGRMSSVDLPDEPDKSLSSNSASPCPSPVKQTSSRHADELDLKAGYKVTVIDTSDPDWWKGKCLGKVGYFPSKYCTKLQAGERPLQVSDGDNGLMLLRDQIVIQVGDEVDGMVMIRSGDNRQGVSDGDNGLMLLRDQIVIQVGDEVDGMVMIRSGDNRQGVCPVKFLQEKRGSPSDEPFQHYVPKSIRSAPVTPCDSENSTWSEKVWSKQRYLSPDFDPPYEGSTDRSEDRWNDRTYRRYDKQHSRYEREYYDSSVYDKGSSYFKSDTASACAGYDKRDSRFDKSERYKDSQYDRYEPSSLDSGYDKGNSNYEDGMWWWRRPLGVRRSQCRRCGASSSTRPLRMTPCAGAAQEETDRRPLSRDRPLLFFKQMFL